MRHEHRLRCEHVSLRFGGVIALDDVTLSVPDAMTTGIIGPNGAGKTTLFNVLTGFARPQAGKTYLGDIETTNYRPHQFPSLGVARTFQELRLIAGLSVLENLLLALPRQQGENAVRALWPPMYARQERENRQRGAEMLGKVGLGNTLDQTAGTLSYGQQKILSIACCLATGAETLMLDEPVAGLHPDVAMAVLGVLKQIGMLGKTIVLIEHDIEAVKRTCDHVIVMDEGKLVAQGSPDEVLQRPEIVEAYLA